MIRTEICLKHRLEFRIEDQCSACLRQAAIMLKARMAAAMDVKVGEPVERVSKSYKLIPCATCGKTFLRSDMVDTAGRLYCRPCDRTVEYTLEDKMREEREQNRG